MERNMAIAEEIVKQLGGRRFILMTGAYDFVALGSGVGFKLPSDKDFVKQGIDTVEVILTPDDTYTVRFLRDTELVSEHENIHNDQLQELFTSVTGLDTHL